MEDNKKYELGDEALDQVAGGFDRWNPDGEVTRFRYVRNENYACSNCGGHDFKITAGNLSHYHGDCVNCGTYHTYICRVDYAGVELYWA